VTEPHHRTSSVRRTVTIAVALVVGQLALCSVIGWVTFGDLLDGSPPRDPGALPVIVSPVPEPAPTPAPSSAAVPAVTTWAARTAAATRTTAPRTSRPAVAPTSAAGRPTPSASKPDAVLLPAPGDEEAVQEPVERRAPCSPEDALGRTKDGDWLRCRQTDDGELRWRAV
jgi:hypothetical protein